MRCSIIYIDCDQQGKRPLSPSNVDKMNFQSTSDNSIKKKRKEKKKEKSYWKEGMRKMKILDAE